MMDRRPPSSMAARWAVKPRSWSGPPACGMLATHESVCIRLHIIVHCRGHSQGIWRCEGKVLLVVSHGLTGPWFKVRAVAVNWLDKCA
jgi:hypothetical protein